MKLFLREMRGEDMLYFSQVSYSSSSSTRFLLTASMFYIYYVEGV